MGRKRKIDELKRMPNYLVKQIKKFNELFALYRVKEDDVAFNILYWFLEDSGYIPSYYLAENDFDEDSGEMIVIRSDEENYQFVQFNTIP